MKTFVVIYHAPVEAMAKMATATPEEKAEGMKPWMAWMEKTGSHLINSGSPFMPGLRIAPDGSTQDSTNEVTGYSILEAEDIDHAKSMLTGHPHLQWMDKCAIEVFECIPMS